LGRLVGDVLTWLMPPEANKTARRLWCLTVAAILLIILGPVALGHLLGLLDPTANPGVPAIRVERVQPAPGPPPDPGAPAEPIRLTRTLEGHLDAVSSVTFCSGGCHGLSASLDGSVRFWETNNWQTVRRLLRPDAVYCAVLGPNGRRVLTAGADGTVRVGNPNTGEELKRLEGHKGPVRCVAFVAVGQAVSAGDDGTARVWDITGEKELRRFTGHTAAVLSIDVSPSGDEAVSSDADGLIWVWKIEDATKRFCLRGHHGPVPAAVFSPNGRYVLSGGADKTVREWDARTGAVVRILSGHATPINAVAYRGDSRIALSADADPTVRVWDLETGIEVGRLEGHARAVTSVAYAPDGRTVLTGSRDATVRVWDVPGPRPRNPFGLDDVRGADDREVQAFAAGVQLTGGPEDRNAAAWVTTETEGSPGALDGTWSTRWDSAAEKKLDHFATARVHTVGDRVYIHLVAKDGLQNLVEARRLGNRLVGRYVNPHDPPATTPWVGLIVSPERIDGIWGDGRWDLRRKLKQTPAPP
jgi:WD40 repeat protein